MFSIDLECKNEHRFEGYFKDYNAFKDQEKKKIITCPLCNTSEVKRIFTGCSIQAKSSIDIDPKRKHPRIFESLREINNYVRNNFEYVGDNFAEEARSMYYGLEDYRNIYGKTSLEDIKELAEEGITVFPLIDADKFEN